MLATVVVVLWLADCSPVESHPLCASCVDAALFFALRCRVASLLCSCLFAMLAAVLTAVAVLKVLRVALSCC